MSNQRSNNTKVAFITHYESLYGANRSLLGLIDGLREYNVSPFVIGREPGAIGEALKIRGVPFQVFPFEWWARSRPPSTGLVGGLQNYIEWRKSTFGRLRVNLGVLPKMVKQLQAWNVDLIYSNSSVTPIGLMAAHRLSCPHIWHLREFCDLYFGLEFDCGRRFFEFFIGRSDAIISVSKAIDNYYLRGVDDKLKHVIYNGVASRDFIIGLYEKSHDRVPNNPYRFTMLGSIQHGKGQIEAVKALAEIAVENRNVMLSIVGGGDITELKMLATDLDVTNLVEFHGYVDDPFMVLLASDAVLVCSRNEAMGRVAVEAMSACRPVIGYDHAGTSELIEHENTGLLYQGGHLGLASAMRRFLADPMWAQNLGINGWQVAKQKFSVEEYAKNIVNVIKSVLDKG